MFYSFVRSFETFQECPDQTKNLSFKLRRTGRKIKHKESKLNEFCFWCRESQLERFSLLRLGILFVGRWLLLFASRLVRRSSRLIVFVWVACRLFSGLKVKWDVSAEWTSFKKPSITFNKRPTKSYFSAKHRNRKFERIVAQREPHLPHLWTAFPIREPSPFQAETSRSGRRIPLRWLLRWRLPSRGSHRVRRKPHKVHLRQSK